MVPNEQTLLVAAEKVQVPRSSGSPIRALSTRPVDHDPLVSTLSHVLVELPTSRSAVRLSAQILAIKKLPVLPELPMEMPYF